MNELPDDIRAVEATLFAAEEPMTAEEIRDYVGVHTDVAGALAALQGHYAGRGIELVERGRRWHFQTAPDLAHLLRRERDEARRLSRAAVETLAIIAYHEPVSRAEIEAIRGVQISKGTLDVLMEAGWVGPRDGARCQGDRSLMPPPPAFSLISACRAAATCPASTISRRRACSTRSTQRWNRGS
jgi:segregation and condensation protein B